MNLHDIQEAVLDIKRSLPIQQDRLDDECRRQTDLVEEAGTLFVMVHGAMRRKKDELEYVRAQLYLDIRHDSTAFQIGAKPPSAAVDACVSEQSDYRKAVAELRLYEEMLEDIKVVQALVDTRRSMIHELVKLFVYNYAAIGQDNNMGVISVDRSALNKLKEDRLTQLRKQHGEKDE